MNRLGRAVLNSPVRATAQRRFVVPTMCRLGGALDAGSRVLEVGCGRGAGSTLIVDLLDAASVDAIDIDPVMVRLATRRLVGHRLAERVDVTVGDMLHVDAPSGCYDAVVDMGAIHLEPRWREAVVELHRVLKPGGRFYFEEIVHPGRQALSLLAAGRRVPLDFGLAAFQAELDAQGFGPVGLQTVGWPARLGLAGDVIGVVASDERPAP